MPTDGARSAHEVSLAIDIGGTKLACGLVDDAGRLLCRQQVPTPGSGTGEAVFETVAMLVRRTVARGRQVGHPPPIVCGVGCAGPMTMGGLSVSPLNIAAWRNFPLRDRLAEVTQLHTVVDNDAKALTLAEGWCGAAVGFPSYLGMVVSTGVGGGLVLDGRMLEGGDGNAGHVGHITVEPLGQRCVCGARGCLEAEASGSAIARFTGSAAEAATPAIVERSGMMVGRAIASVACLLDLRLAVVAGSVALGFGEPFFRAAQREIDDRARLSFTRDTVVRPALLGADGPLIGAAAVGWRGLGREILRPVA